MLKRRCRDELCSPACRMIAQPWPVALNGLTAIPLEGSFRGYAELGGERIDLEYKWVPLSDLPHMEIYPPEVVPFLLYKQETGHFVCREIGKDAFKEA